MCIHTIMNHVELFQDQIDSVEPISQEFVDNLITTERHPLDKRTDEQIREQWPIGDKKVYAVVVTEITDREDVEKYHESNRKMFPDGEYPNAGAERIKSVDIVAVLASEIDDWVERNNLVYAPVERNLSESPLPRFEVRSKLT